ncbi:unnamed protein product [Lathyrus sativus]|nr:unnamed protein product [Lathyrus sativus]
MDENQSATSVQNGGYLKSNIFTLTIPEIDGGSNLSIKMHWSQKVECSNGEYSLNVPFTFPDFVNPIGKRMSKREKIQLNMDVVA